MTHLLRQVDTLSIGHSSTSRHCNSRLQRLDPNVSKTVGCNSGKACNKTHMFAASRVGHARVVLRPQSSPQSSCTVRKMEEMEGRLKVVGDAIAELDASRDALLAQLAQVEALLTQAHAERADLEESRSVYEEGVAFSLDALQHQVMLGRLTWRPAAFAYRLLFADVWACMPPMHIPDGPACSQLRPVAY